VPRPKPGSNIQDFKKLNKMAAIAHVSNATDLKNFKAVRDVKVVPATNTNSQPKVIPSDVIPSFAYGRKSRPSTPINAVVGYQYAAEYEEALANTYGGYASTEGMKLKVKHTGTSRAAVTHQAYRRAAADRVPEPLFKMTKFKKVPSRLQLEPINKSASSPALY
jgi:hypothetical protein